MCFLGVSIMHDVGHSVVFPTTTRMSHIDVPFVFIHNHPLKVLTRAEVEGELVQYHLRDRLKVHNSWALLPTLVSRTDRPHHTPLGLLYPAEVVEAARTATIRHQMDAQGMDLVLVIPVHTTLLAVSHESALRHVRGKNAYLRVGRLSDIRQHVTVAIMARQ